MNIGLVDVDSHNFPNLALMKLSAYHKSIGDKIEFCQGILKKYDLVYKSKVFTFTEDSFPIQSNKIVEGGSGYSLNLKLPLDIENIYPDYSLYNIKNTAYGYLTRGCPRNCSFCIVSSKEGKQSIKVNNLENFWKGQKEIVLLDSNILACKDRVDLLDQLIESKSSIDFNQGLDIKLVSYGIIDKIKKLKIKRIHFAWDNYDNTLIEKFRYFMDKTRFTRSKVIVYVLVNFNTEFKYDLFRIYTLRDLGYSPYIMIYNKINCKKKYKHLARWVNSNIIFRACKNFDEYKKFIKIDKYIDNNIKLF
jgi:hypothetical protein